MRRKIREPHHSFLKEMTRRNRIARWTPLMIAAFHGNKKICVYLVEKKADPTLMNAYKKCAQRK